MLHEGQVLNDRYRIEHELGRGGMGSVYLATHLGLEGMVAVKEMIVALPDNEERAAAMRQFRTEAQMLHRLQHPYLPRVHDFFESDCLNYIVMDFVEGGTLRDQLMKRGPLPEHEVLGYALQLCDVLEHLHRQDPPVVFRDLKPSNIMLDRAGRIQLIDFGLAKVLNPVTGSGTQTAIRGSGSPGYAAPEQYGSSTDPRSDVYALGCTMYHLLTGNIPPQSIELASGMIPLVPVREMRSDLSPYLADAIERMMRLNRDERPASMAEVRALLVPVRAIGGQPTTVPAKARGSARALSPLAAVAMAAVVLAGIFFGYGFLRRERAVAEQPRKPVATTPAKAVPVALTLAVSPVGSTLLVDGAPLQKLGTPPVHVTLKPGAHRLEFRREGYKSVFMSSGPDRPLANPLQVTLAPNPALLTVEQPVGRTLVVDGYRRGTLPVKGLALAPGRHEIKVDSAEYPAQEITVAPGEVRAVAFQAAAAQVPSAPAAQPRVVAVATPSYPTYTPTPSATTVSYEKPAYKPADDATPTYTSYKQVVSSGGIEVAPGDHFGPLRLGSSIESAVASLGGRCRRREDRIGTTYIFYDEKLFVVARDNRVVGIAKFLCDRKMECRTPSGQALWGSTESDMTREFGPGTASYGLPAGPETSLTWYTHSQGIAFQYKNGQVAGVMVLDPQVLAYAHQELLTKQRGVQGGRRTLSLGQTTSGAHSPARAFTDKFPRR